MDSKRETIKHGNFVERCNEILTLINFILFILNSTTSFNSVHSVPSTSRVTHFPIIVEVIKRMQTIVVKLKNSQQTSFGMKSDLKHVINPTSINIPICNVKHNSNDEMSVGSNKVYCINQLKETVVF